jgi:hypothetical protein
VLAESSLEPQAPLVNTVNLFQDSGKLSYITGTRNIYRENGRFLNKINNLACSLAPEHTDTHGTETLFRFCLLWRCIIMPLPHHHLATIMKDSVTKSRAKKKPTEVGWLG